MDGESMSDTLFELGFSDLYIHPVPSDCWFKTRSDSKERVLVPEHLHNELVHLRNHIVAQDKGEEFRIKWHSDFMRVGRINGIDGTIYALRNWKRQSVRNLAELGFPRRIAQHIVSPRLKSGLILMMGQQGSGKTSSAAACLIERLTDIGGVARVIEAPAEMALEGQHGKGYCYQTDLKSDEMFAAEIKHAVRAAIDILLIGEIRSAEVAREAVLAAAAGLVVISTFHANSLQIGLRRFNRICHEQELFAEALQAAFHLTLTENDGQIDSSPLPGRTVTNQMILSVDPLLLTGKADDVRPIRNAIREDQIQTLSTAIQRQRDFFMSTR